MTDIPTPARDLTFRDVGFTLVYSDEKTSVRAPIVSIHHSANEVSVWVQLGDSHDGEVRFDFDPDTEVKVADAQY
ncbi:hypothetical protein [Gordonia sp. 4N]|uniref:hypothetical protein n=1 Tax=Gordonia sp. 4N TaxID=2993508 RepID=UPI002248AE21|nr:hypothetical protein [Gordonia sp. 4N]MCX2753062.1 hypothetical protein [Gordonia sp. 4N]